LLPLRLPPGPPGPPWSGAPLNTKTRLVPMLEIDPVIDACAPLPTASMAITAATPITIPRTVKPERSLLPFKLSMASRRDCEKFIFWFSLLFLHIHQTQADHHEDESPAESVLQLLGHA